MAYSNEPESQEAMAWQTVNNDDDLVLSWSTRADKWIEAMPIGNGRLGAMVFGGTSDCRIQINDSTVWSGHPDQPGEALLAVLSAGAGPGRLQLARDALDAGNYDLANELLVTFEGRYSQEFLPFVDLFMTSTDLENAEYLGRTLNLDCGVVEEKLRRSDSVIHRRMWISRPDNALIVEIDVEGEPIGMQVRLDSPLRIADRQSEPSSIGLGVDLPIDGPPLHEPQVEPALLYSHEAVNGYDAYATAQLVVTTDGTQSVVDESLEISDFRHVRLIFTSSTAPGIEWETVAEGAPARLEREAHRADAHARALGVAQYSSCDLLTRHVDDLRELLGSMSLRIGANSGGLVPVSGLLSEERDEALLMTVMFQFGRYLLASSSRPDMGPPPNLQGIWNEELRPAWSSSYTNDINIQMNHWAAEITGLSECHEPLFDLVEKIVPEGNAVAQQLYGNTGWVLHSNTDIWGWALPVGMGHGDLSWAFFTGGGSWLALHFWEHYEFTGDSRFLAERAFQVIAGAARFYLDWLVPALSGDGLDLTPSMSPENIFVAADGSHRSLGRSSTMDIALARAVLDAFVKGAGILQLGELESDIEAARDALARLPRFSIDSRSRLHEWDNEYPAANESHRHISPLITVYPLDLIDPLKTPELAVAASNLLDSRGPGAIGWSWAWMASCRARLGQPDVARELLIEAMTPLRGDPTIYAADDSTSDVGGLLPNLFSSHPPFQIDANLGFTAAIVEMLVQSHGGLIRILPAVPRQWGDLTAKGIRCRGGLSVDLDMRDGSLVRAEVHRISGVASRPVEFDYRGNRIELEIPLGTSVILSALTFA